jgi:hypothetical protein
MPVISYFIDFENYSVNSYRYHTWLSHKCVSVHRNTLSSAGLFYCFLVYLTMLCQLHCSYTVEWQNDCGLWTEKDVEECSVFCLEVSSQFVWRNLAISQKASCMPEIWSEGTKNFSRRAILLCCIPSHHHNRWPIHQVFQAFSSNLFQINAVL